MHVTRVRPFISIRNLGEIGENLSRPDAKQTSARLRYAVEHAQTCHVIPPCPSGLSGRSGVIIERAEPVHRAITVVDTVVEVPACDCSVDRTDIPEHTGIHIEEWVGKTMWRTSFLVRQRHESSNNWAR